MKVVNAKRVVKPNFVRTRKQNHWWTPPVIILVACCIAAFVIIRSESVTPTDSMKIAKKVDCLGTDKESSFDCWTERMEAFVAQHPTTDEAFADIEAANNTSAYVRSNCHQIAHVIGRAAGRKYGDVAKAYQDGDDFCWSGYYHGVMEAIIAATDKQKITEHLDDICATLRLEAPYNFNHYNCVHGLGHGIHQLENSELFVALDTCATMKDSWEAQSCYGGVFMENVMNEINPGHESRYLNNDEPLYPCTAVKTQYMEQCYLMQTSHALRVVGNDFVKVFSLCAGVQAPYDLTCFQSLGRDASGTTVSDITRTQEYCNLGPTETARTYCYIGAVKDFISFHHDDDEGLKLCATISESVVSATCTQTAENYYRSL